MPDLRNFYISARNGILAYFAIEYMGKCANYPITLQLKIFEVLEAKQAISSQLFGLF